jgi:hypothetical protein
MEAGREGVGPAPLIGRARGILMKAASANRSRTNMATGCTGSGREPRADKARCYHHFPFRECRAEPLPS